MLFLNNTIKNNHICHLILLTEKNGTSVIYVFSIAAMFH